MKKRDLPIGIQTLKNMREGGFIYIDKTEHIYPLVNQQGSYFLSRPRRFGKSLLVSTMKELFEGNRAYLRVCGLKISGIGHKKAL